MKLFNLFKKKSISNVREITEQDSGVKEVEIICEYCGKKIYGEQKIKTFNGKKYHLKPCWYNLQKEAFKQYKGS